MVVRFCWCGCVVEVGKCVIEDDMFVRSFCDCFNRIVEVSEW